MKITKTVLLTFLVTLISSVSGVLAGVPAAGPPAPLAAGPPPPPGGSIDQNLIFLFVGALIFGTYTILKYNNMKKASM